MEELRHSCSDSLAVRHPGSGLATLKQGGGGVMPRLLRSVFKLFKLGRLEFNWKGLRRFKFDFSFDCFPQKQVCCHISVHVEELLDIAFRFDNQVETENAKSSL